MKVYKVKVNEKIYEVEIVSVSENEKSIVSSDELKKHREDHFYSEKLKNLLNTKYGYNIFKIIDSIFRKMYMAFIYVKTEAELRLLTDNDREKIKSIIIDYYVDTQESSNEIKQFIFYFDSDENVQKNYRGNYFYATR